MDMSFSSFSSVVRQELCALPVSDEAPHCARSELAAMFSLVYHSTQESFTLHRSTPEMVQRFGRLIERGFREKELKINTYIQSKNLHTIEISGMNRSLYTHPDKSRPCCRRAYVRGSYIADGIISNPQRTYHLEFTFPTSYSLTQRLVDILTGFDLHPRTFQRKAQTVIYIKEAENISDALNIMKAHKSLLDFENMRVEKDLRNTVNRKVNFETANLNKTVNAAVSQIDAIQYIAEKAGLEYLSKPLEEVARLRLAYQEASMQEIGDMLTPPIGKSGVNHRLRKITKIAEELQVTKMTY
jgi:DNA-binding transcriptional regulator WhiA